MINLNYKTVKKLALIYMMLPTMLFFFTWLKIYIAAAAIILLLAGLIFAIREDKTGEAQLIILTKRSLILLVLIALIWCLFAGQGGIFYQSDDHYYRNAIFRDLINYSWPVVYENNNSMVYYIGHWLVPSLFGKLALQFGSEETAWMTANTALLVWSTIGVVIVFLLLMVSVKAKSTKEKYLTILVFILFSGLDIIGIMMQCFTNRRILMVNHLESYSGFWEYSSVSTLLFWVYNQAIVAWISILLFYNEKKTSQYALIGLCCLPYAPLPLIGLFPFFIANAIKRFWDSKGKHQLPEFFKEILSIPNITASLTIFPIFYLYYSSNRVVNTRGFGLSNGFTERGLVKTAIILALFFVLEFGLYAVLIWKKNKNNLNYYIAVISLLLIPFIRLGNASDFVMRASIPAITIVMILVIKEVLDYPVTEKSNHKGLKRKLYIALILALFIGAVTPAFEFGRSGIKTLNGIKTDMGDMKELNTLAEEKIDDIANFATANSDQLFFYKFLAK